MFYAFPIYLRMSHSRRTFFGPLTSSSSKRSHILSVIIFSFHILFLSYCTSYLHFMSSLFGSRTLSQCRPMSHITCDSVFRCLFSSWSPCCQFVHIVHVINLPRDFLCLECRTCSVPFMSFFFSMYYFRSVWVMSYCIWDTFTTSFYMPFLSNCVCPFHVVHFLDLLLPLRLSDLIFSMW
jgi:hypothetical protein